MSPFIWTPYPCLFVCNRHPVRGVVARLNAFSFISKATIEWCAEIHMHIYVYIHAYMYMLALLKQLTPTWREVRIRLSLNETFHDIDNSKMKNHENKLKWKKINMNPKSHEKYYMPCYVKENALPPQTAPTLLISPPEEQLTRYIPVTEGEKRMYLQCHASHGTVFVSTWITLGTL